MSDILEGCEVFDGSESAARMVVRRYGRWLRTYPVRMRNLVMRLAASEVKAVPLLVQALKDRRVLTHAAWWQKALRTNWGVVMWDTIMEDEPRPESWRNVMRGVDQKEFEKAAISAVKMVKVRRK